jgi:hypothetical protein
MSLDIYNIAKVAQAKLLFESQCKDHNLYKIVAHAKLYDEVLDAVWRQELPAIKEVDEEGRDKLQMPASSYSAKDGDASMQEKVGTLKEERFEDDFVTEFSHVESVRERAEVTVVEVSLEDDD